MDVSETAVKASSVRTRAPSKRKKPTTGDLAELVRDKTLKAVKAGTLKPTLQHGLMAQQMLDKRAERAADRQLAIRLAAMLGGGKAPDGVIIDVTPRALQLTESDDDDGFSPIDD
jgi:hypothetical protein